MMTSPCSSIRTRGALGAVEELEPLVHAVADESLELALDPILERAHARSPESPCRPRRP